jgi:hypothetical protein
MVYHSAENLNTGNIENFVTNNHPIYIMKGTVSLKPKSHLSQFLQQYITTKKTSSTNKKIKPLGNTNSILNNNEQATISNDPSIVKSD